MAVDPRTPVIVGVGQFTENIDDPGYRGMSAVELATEAARAALTDTGADADAVAKAIDVVVGLRQFEISGPMPAKLGKSNNYPRSVMQRLGAQPARSVLEPVGGQGPQKLVTEFGTAIANGEADVVMIIGSEPGSTARYFAKRDDKPDFTEHIDGQLEDRGHQIFHYISEYTDQARADRRARAVRTAGQRASRPARAERRRLPPADGRAVRAVLENRCQEPVFVVAGRALGGGDRHGHRRQPDDLRPVSAAAGRPRPGQPGRGGRHDVGGRRASPRCARGEVGVSARPLRHGRAGPAGPRRPRRQPRDGARRAAKRCEWRKSVSTTSPPSICTAASRSRCSSSCEALGIDGDDPRGLTLTGGLPYFGGPGNSYSLHAIAETVAEMRDKPGQIRFRRRQRRHHEQVLGGHLLDPAGRIGGQTAARRSTTRSPRCRRSP